MYGFFDGVRPTRWTNLTLLEAVEHGWWYAAHLPGERLAVAIAADIADVHRLGLRGAEGWLRALRRTEHVVAFVGRGQRPREPLVVRHAPSFLSSRPVGESWLAVGDAASSFDPITEWFWVADVGQDSIEEIDVVEIGENYGWDIMEGTICHEPLVACPTCCPRAS